MISHFGNKDRMQDYLSIILY